MPKDPFHTSKGELTRYALACGYIEREEYGTDDTFRSVTLEMSGSVIQVKIYYRDDGTRHQFTTSSIMEARLVYKSCKMILSLGQLVQIIVGENGKVSWENN